MFNIKKIGRFKLLIISLSALLVLSVGTGAAFAYIATQTPPTENTFTPGRVECAVNEEFDGNVKSNVSIKNTGNVTSYIRAALVINWQSKTDSTEILARPPKEGIDYVVIYGDSLWIKDNDDGYWYYTQPVSPDTDTSNLITSIAPKEMPPEGYTLSVEVIASAIQAYPVTVVEQEWGVQIANGELVP